MTLQLLSRSPPVRRRRSCSPDDPKMARRGKNYGGMVGGSAAECTSVCCCFPFTIMTLLFLGLYKVPTGLCKKACKRKKRNRKNQGLYPTPPMEDLDTELDRMVKGDQSGDNDDDGSTGAVESEEKTLDRFFGTGFWRDPSQRETYDDVMGGRN